MRAYKSTYQHSHHNFVQAYRMINEYVTGLYLLPKKLVADAEETLDNYYVDTKVPGASEKMDTTCRVMIDFMDQLDDFTVHTIALFTEHKKHVDASREYMKKVSAAQLKQNADATSEYADHDQKLTNELNNLMEGLKEIKEKADQMITRLEKLELRWESIKINNSASH